MLDQLIQYLSAHPGVMSAIVVTAPVSYTHLTLPTTPYV